MSRCACAVTVLILSAACGPRPPEAPSAQAAIPLDQARRLFGEAEAVCRADGGALWGRAMCGPMMFVDRATRFAVANRGGAGGALQERSGGVFTGKLPPDQSIANTAFTWAGETWVQLVWPLPAGRDERAILMMHEQFHRVQPGLGFTAASEGATGHLDQLEGRYWLQLEWRALAAALRATGDRDRAEAVGDALAFRAARRRAVPEAAKHEDALELHEGLAEYTGIVVGVRGDEARTAAALRDLAAHVDDTSFMRSFAYATGPAYGLLLDRFAPGWRKRVLEAGSLGALLAERASPPARDAEQAAVAYDGAALRASETERAARRDAEIARYRRLLVDGPVLTLPLAHMKIEFDPRAVVPIPDVGSVYPTLRLVDDWGVLEVTGGALLGADWKTVVVVAPRSPAERAVPGSWKLELAAGWTVSPDQRAGDFRVAGS